MKLISAEFVTSAAAGGRADGIPRDGLPQIALAGRSNVGKSSLLNALCRRTIARTSAAPGKTRLANVYRLQVDGGAGPGHWGLYLVDLPGYGYARGGADSAKELGAVAEAYFGSPAPVARRFSGASDTESPTSDAALKRRATGEGEGALKRGVLQLIDSRHPGLQADIDAARWFDSFGVVRHIVATKVDKLTRAERARNLREFERVFGTAALPVSVTSGEGLDALWTLIARLARQPQKPR